MWYAIALTALGISLMLGGMGVVALHIDHKIYSSTMEPVEKLGMCIVALGAVLIFAGLALSYLRN